ncbi:MAG: nitrilase-related carbon-nitrogen hydrolase [Anaerolineae bacterium]
MFHLDHAPHRIEANDPPSNVIRLLVGVTLSALSAGMLLVAFPPYNIWPLVFVALIPSLLAQYRILPPTLSAVGQAVASGGFVGVYFLQIFPFLGELAWYMQGLPLFIALFSFVTQRGYRAFHERTRYRWFVLHGIADWVGVEMIRGFIPFIGTWAFVGYTLWDQNWLLQPMSIFGIFGLNALILLANYALAQVTLRLFDHRFPWNEAPAIAADVNRRWLAALVVVAMAWTALSVGMLAAAPPAPETVRVAAVQPNPSTLLEEGQNRWALDETERATLMEKLLARLREQTIEAAQAGAKIVVWPEGQVTFDPQEKGTDFFQALTRETGVHLVIGYVEDTKRGLRNEATVLTPEGEFLGTYGKAHPVVFGGETSLTRGIYPTYDTPWSTLATIICYDLNFTDVSRIMARRGAQIIAVPSADWPAIAERQYTHLRFRAIENRVGMIKADMAYDSVITDPHGRTLAHDSSPQGHETVLMANLPLGTGDSIYVTLGDWVGWICLAGLAFFTFYIPVVVRRADRNGR